MPQSRPSDELFRSRLNDLVEGTSIREVADRYNTNPRNVRNWLAGRNVPRSAATARSVSRTALRQGYSVPVIQATDSAGRFTTVGQITDRRALGYVARQRERLISRRNVAIRAANTPASRAAADALPMEPDMNFVRELQARRRNLLASGARGTDRVPIAPASDRLDAEGPWDYGMVPDSWNEFGGFDSWDDWRDDLVSSYEQMGG